MDKTEFISKSGPAIAKREVLIGESKKTYYIKELLPGEITRLQSSTKGGKQLTGFFSRVVQVGMCDETGKSIFDSTDLPTLDTQYWVPKVAAAIMQFNGLHDRDDEDYEKN